MATASAHVHTRAVEKHAIKKQVETLRSAHAFIASAASAHGAANPKWSGVPQPGFIWLVGFNMRRKVRLLAFTKVSRTKIEDTDMPEDCIFTNHLP
jgi:hypothetical protein